MKTRQLALDAMLAAMCAVLGYISIDTGNLKVTFESLPILVGALLFGPLDGLLIGGIGTGIYQLLRYGISATTILWMLPYVICGFMVGYFSKKTDFSLNKKQILALVISAELLITVLNTGVLYIDSIIYGYYSAAFIFGSLILRFVICIAKAIAFAVVLPELIKPVKKFFVAM